MKLPTLRLQVALALPLLGLLALIARAEIALRSGPSFLIPIAGYDPRDPLSGHYLRYRFAFDWRGQSACGSLWEGKPVALDRSCCVCLTANANAGRASSARQVPCADAVACAGRLQGAAIQEPLRYFVPEEQAPALDGALRGGRASVAVTCGSQGQPAVGELFLDGRPWRDVVRR